MFIFQPAEEGPSLYPASNEKSWGAKAMIKAGILKDPRPDAIFGLHVVSSLPSGQIGYRPGAALASADELRIKVIGQPGHAGIPWRAIDPVTTAAQIVIRYFQRMLRHSGGLLRDSRASPNAISMSPGSD
jgi:metal-dependent amidase/aminoacylase/carboxypeptidase family protein